MQFNVSRFSCNYEQNRSKMRNIIYKFSATSKLTTHRRYVEQDVLDM